MKHTCKGCRAYEYDVAHGPIKYHCSLGYNEKDGRPLEACPKPRTISQLCELSLHGGKHGETHSTN